jgi:Txe/YoeB family toxin of Txe-Axe toxin-antitoxin module
MNHFHQQQQHFVLLVIVALATLDGRTYSFKKKLFKKIIKIIKNQKKNIFKILKNYLKFSARFAATAGRACCSG